MCVAERYNPDSFTRSPLAIAWAIDTFLQTERPHLGARTGSFLERGQRPLP
jgi:hypothetical protein